MDARSKPPVPPVPVPVPAPVPRLPPRDRKTSLKSGPPAPAVAADPVDSAVDVDGMRALALSRPDFKFAFPGSRPSPC